VDNLDRLIDNLCTIWIGRLRLHDNVVRFQRESGAYSSQPKKGNEGFVKRSFAYVLKSGNHVPIMAHDSAPAIVLDDSCIMEKDFSCSLMRKVKDINVLSNLYLTFTNEGLPIKMLTRNTFDKIVSSWGELINVEDHVNVSLSYKKLCVKTRNNVIINDTIKIIVKGQVYWIRVKELEAWTPDLNNELDDDSSYDEESLYDEAVPINKGKKKR
nr:DIE2/ALG10 family [Tanacetum cinerariifolium]